MKIIDKKFIKIKTRVKIQENLIVSGCVKIEAKQKIEDFYHKNKSFYIFFSDIVTISFVHTYNYC